MGGMGDGGGTFGGGVAGTGGGEPLGVVIGAGGGDCTYKKDADIRTVLF